MHPLSPFGRGAARRKKRPLSCSRGVGEPSLILSPYSSRSSHNGSALCRSSVSDVRRASDTLDCLRSIRHRRPAAEAAFAAAADDISGRKDRARWRCPIAWRRRRSAQQRSAFGSGALSLRRSDGLGMTQLVGVILLVAVCCFAVSSLGQQRPTKSAECVNKCQDKYALCDARIQLSRQAPPKRAGPPQRLSAAGARRITLQQVCEIRRIHCESLCRRRPRSVSAS